MDQPELNLKVQMQAVDAALIARQSSFTGALMLCQQLSGLEDKEVCKSLGIDPAHWSRVKVGQAHFPQERLEKLMDVCGNEVPLFWLSYRRGYELTPMLTEMERRLLVEKAEKDRLAAENKILREMLTGRSV